MSDSVITLKGRWLSMNEFVDEYGEIIEVVPYQCISRVVGPLLPMDCYILLENRRVVLSYCPIDSLD